MPGASEFPAQGIQGMSRGRFDRSGAKDAAHDDRDDSTNADLCDPA